MAPLPRAGGHPRLSSSHLATEYAEPITLQKEFDARHPDPVLARPQTLLGQPSGHLAHLVHLRLYHVRFGPYVSLKNAVADSTIPGIL